MASSSASYVTTPGGDAWAQDAAKQGRVGTQRLLGVEQVKADDAAQRALRLAPGDEVVVRRRLILADGEPVELADSIYPARIAAGTDLAADRKIRGGAVAALTALGHRIMRASEQVTARPPDSTEVDQLDIEPNQPLLILTRVGYDEADSPVELAVNRMVASRVAPISNEIRVSS